MRQITISANDGVQWLDKFLQKFMPALPQALMYRYLREKRVRINSLVVAYAGYIKSERCENIACSEKGTDFIRHYGCECPFHCTLSSTEE